MTREERVSRIKEARSLIWSTLSGSDSPQIETMLRNADLELHWALWNLGEPVALRPELDFARNST